MPDLTALGAYVFAGGFTLGVQERFRVLAHLEGDGGYGADCARANWPDLEVRHGPANWRDADFAGVDFVFTNPPCAIFSQAGQSQVGGTDWRLDPRVACWSDCFGLLERLRPRAWALESVTQAYSKGRELVDDLTRRALMLGYSVTHVLEDAANHGLPQRRQRFVLVAHRPARLAHHGMNWAPTPDVMDVLGLVDEPGPVSPSPDAHLAILPHVRPGGSLRTTWEKLGRPRLKESGAGPAFLYYRLATGKPRHALVGNRCYHPLEHRLLGENEMRAVCGFPPDFVLTGGNPHENGSLLARGLMPPVAAWLSGVVARTLEDGVDVTEREGLRVTLLDLLAAPGREVDLTAEYLTESGKVRIRAGGARELVHSVPSGSHAEAARATVADRAALEEVIVGTEIDADSVMGVPLARQGEGSGKFMQRLLLETELSPDEIVAAVHANWEGRTTKVSDCYYNYKILERAGTPGLRPWSSRPKVRGGATPPAAVPAARAAQPNRVMPSEPPVAPATTATAVDPARGDVAPPAGPEDFVHELQPTRSGRAHKHENDFDTTSLTAKGYGYRVHRDYAAHFFRWGFTARHVRKENSVLEVGCGTDFPFVNTLIGAYGSHVPHRYVGVDLNRLNKPPQRPWAEYHGEFDFTTRAHELGTFDVIISLEVIEHMTRAHGQRMLEGVRDALEPDGRAFISTPVFDGYAAANHVHEYTIPELQGAVEAAGLRVVKRYGTFANYRDIKKVATPEQMRALDGLNEFYSTDVTACFLAPLYPDASRNNLWILARADD